MRTEHGSAKRLVIGLLGIALAGCSNAGEEEEGTSESTGGVSTSGGTNPTATGGTTSVGATGGSGAGGLGSGGLGSGGLGSGGLGSGGLGSGGLGSGGLGSGGLGSGGVGTGGLGGSGTGGSTTGGSSSGGNGVGGTESGGSAGGETGGSSGAGGDAAGGASGGLGGAGGSESGGSPGTGGNIDPGDCTPSVAVNRNASGSGPHAVTVETNADPGINEGTIFRPADLGGDEKYPIFAWGEGACSLDGLSNSAAMAEIASHGYFVIADGTPNGSGSRPMNSGDVVSMGEPLLAYISWALAENDKPCSAYHQSLDATKIATNGFSCGGLMAEGTAGDPRITTWGITSSGMLGADQSFYQSIHTPVLIILGGPSDTAYGNGERDYDGISAVGVPIMLFSKDIGHGGDLWSARGGDFTKINLAWLNWWLKGDEGATGKGVLVGSGCAYCADGAWEVKSANLP